MSDQLNRVRLHDLAAQLRAMSDNLASLAEEAGDKRTNTDLAAYVTAIIHARRLREKALGADLFFDPAWDIMLTLFLAKLDDRPLRVTDLGVVPVAATTLLRWISNLEAAGIVVRTGSSVLGRRAGVTLSDQTMKRMTDYLKSVTISAI